MPVTNDQLLALTAQQRAQVATVKARAKVVLQKTGNDIARDAKTIAHQKFSSAATGATANSINARMVNDLSIRIGPTTYYAIFVELGTSRMPAKPFMTPAAERHEPAFLEAIGRIGEGDVT